MSSVAAPVRTAGGATRDGVRRISLAVCSPTGLLLVTFAALRLIAVLRSPTSFPDTSSYGALDFLGRDERLWSVPLVWSVVPGSHLREGVQIVFGITAWSTLAVILGRMLADRRVRWAGMIAVLILGLVTQVTTWDTALLSESLSTSLAVLLTGLALLLFTDSRRRVVWACLAVMTLWVFTRQSNVMIYLAVLPFVVVFTLRRTRGRRAIAVTAALMAIAVWGGFAITRDTVASQALWRYNAVEILENRIAANPAALRFFEARGLPHPPALLAQRGVFPGPASPLLVDPPFVDWVDHHFRSTYLAYLLGHLANSAGTPLASTLTLASEPVLYGRTVPVLPSPISELLWGTSEGDLAFWLAVAAALALAVQVRGLRIRTAPLAGLLVLAAAVGAIVVWNSAAQELARLFLPVAVFLRLGILLTIACSADALVRARGDS